MKGLELSVPIPSECTDDCHEAVYEGEILVRCAHFLEGVVELWDERPCPSQAVYGDFWLYVERQDGSPRVHESDWFPTEAEALAAFYAAEEGLLAEVLE